MRRARRTWQRRAFAVTAGLLWLLGVEVLPNLHLATHHHDHTHAADGSIVQLHVPRGEAEHSHVHRHGHDHDHGDHEHHAGVDDDELAALGVAHEHFVIEDGLDFLEHDHVDVEDHDGRAAVADLDESAPADDTGARAHRRHRDRTQLAIDHDAAPGHAALGIAHHAMALHQPAPPLLAPVAAPNVETWTHPAPNERISSAERARPTARGPPVG